MMAEKHKFFSLFLLFLFLDSVLRMISDADTGLQTMSYMK